MVDKRLTARLIKSAALLADYPGRAITGTAKSDAAAVDGYYRFIEQPADSQVTVESILAKTPDAISKTVSKNFALACIAADDAFPRHWDWSASGCGRCNTRAELQVPFMKRNLTRGTLSRHSSFYTGLLIMKRKGTSLICQAA